MVGTLVKMLTNMDALLNHVESIKNQILTCSTHANHFIYQKKINNDNNIDFRSYLSLLKRHLLIEREICIAQSQEHMFIKFNPVLEHL